MQTLSRTNDPRQTELRKPGIFPPPHIHIFRAANRHETAAYRRQCHVLRSISPLSLRPLYQKTCIRRREHRGLLHTSVALLRSNNSVDFHDRVVPRRDPLIIMIVIYDRASLFLVHSATVARFPTLSLSLIAFFQRRAKIANHSSCRYQLRHQLWQKRVSPGLTFVGSPFETAANGRALPNDERPPGSRPMPAGRPSFRDAFVIFASA